MAPSIACGLLPGTGGDDMRANFRWMSLWFSVCHGCVTTPLIYSTSVLPEDVGLTGNGILFTMTVLSALLGSVAIIGVAGLKGALMLGMASYSVYVLLFSLAALAIDRSLLGASPQLLFYVGSLCGGFAAGLLWTTQGSYFGRSAEAVAKAEDSSHAHVSGELARFFAICFLGVEVASKLCFSALEQLGLQAWAISMIYAAVSFLSLVAMTRIEKLETPAAGLSASSTLLAAVRLWRDRKIWLLAPMNLAFGFSSAYMNGHFNGYYARRELGEAWIGYLSAITVACAAVFVQVYKHLDGCCGRGVVLAAGAASFAGIPVLMLSLRCCAGWRWWIAVLYVLQGSGRAVYESTNKAVFSDFFVGTRTEGAFANCFMQSSVASALCFFVSGLPGAYIAFLIVICAVLVPVGYLSAEALRNAEELPCPDPGDIARGFHGRAERSSATP